MCRCNIWAISQSEYNRGIKGLSLVAVLVLLILDEAKYNSRIVEENIAELFNLRAMPPRTIASSFIPLLGTCCIIIGMLLSLKNVEVGAS